MAANDPGAPVRPLQRELILLGGFLVCLSIAVVVIVIPELAAGEGAPPQAPAVDGRGSAREPK
jgi:hypothetical protein